MTTAPVPIRKKHWLSVRDAASVIGKFVYGPSWSDFMLDDENSKQCALVTKDLYKAFTSGQVRTFLDDGGDPVRLKEEAVLHFAFQIDLTENSVVLGQLPSHPFDCSVNADDLDRFLKQTNASRAGQKAKDDAEKECHSWLVELMKGDRGNRTKKTFMDEAIAQIGVSQRGFKRAWKDAIKATQSGWDKSGRPKSSR